jgi:hypothetical protein
LGSLADFGFVAAKNHIEIALTSPCAAGPSLRDGTSEGFKRPDGRSNTRKS